MNVDDAVSVAVPSGSGEMAFQLAVLEDASRQADIYWCNWMWHRMQPVFAPSEALLEAGIVRDSTVVCITWKRWFDVLTSWDFVDALIGRDVRDLLDDGELR
ncbi:MAG: hypothetical protein ABI282_01365 [Candidatus Baltobacteraceae bacterium]